MKVRDAVKVEVAGEEPKYGHIVRIDTQGTHVEVCLHDEEGAKAQFELVAREMVPA